MKKSESKFTVVVTSKETGETIQTTENLTQNKMWTTCRETLRADEELKLKVDVLKDDGTLFKSFTRVPRNGKRAWWMHNAVKATNRKWMLKMEREAAAKAEEKQEAAIKIETPVNHEASAEEKEAPKTAKIITA